MKCLIVADGKSSRFRKQSDSKPLMPIMGLPLIECVIRSEHEIGANEFLWSPVNVGIQSAVW